MTQLYTPTDVAERWQCQNAFVFKMIRDGFLPAIRVGALHRIKEEDLLAIEETIGKGPDKKPCDVYVVRCENFVKIGKAYDMAKRMTQLQVSSPFELEVMAVLTDGDGHILEKEIHARFGEYRHRGEWFRLEGDLADWVKTGCGIRSAP